MRRIIVAFWLVFVLSPPGWAALIELPASGGTASGIGIVSGWKCEAGTLTVRFNGGNPLEMPYGSGLHAAIRLTYAGMPTMAMRSS